MNLIKSYFQLQKQIYDHFGYQEDWVVIPLSDHTDDHWMLIEESNSVVYSHEPMTAESVEAGDNIYQANVYKQRFLSKWVYRADDYTMICVDTRCDGNKFLMVFDNKKECKDEGLKELYRQCW